MDLLNNIRLLSLRPAAKISIFLILSAGFLLSCYTIFLVVFSGKTDAIEATGFLFGVVLPLVLLALIVSGTTNGEATLRRKTREILLQVIPQHLAALPDDMPDFSPMQTRAPALFVPKRATVTTNYPGSGCVADYRVLVPAMGSVAAIEFCMRVELNVKRANISLYMRPANLLSNLRKHASALAGDIEDLATDGQSALGGLVKSEAMLLQSLLAAVTESKQQFQERFLTVCDLDRLAADLLAVMQASSREQALELEAEELSVKNVRRALGLLSAMMLRRYFQHTWVGASQRVSDGGVDYYSYQFNEFLLERSLLIDDQTADFYCMVAAVKLPDDFLWDEAHRLFFAQDMML